MARTVALVALVALGAVLVAVVRAPVRPTGLDAVRGSRILRVRPAAVDRLAVSLDERRFAARRAAGGWEIDGRPASPAAAAALEDLVQSLVSLRAVDVFRSRDASAYGLDRPQATIVVETPRGRRQVTLGALNAAGSTVYARRDNDPRIFQLGTHLLTQLQRVLYARDKL